jgi:hypothetical protein
MAAQRLPHNACGHETSAMNNRLPRAAAWLLAMAAVFATATPAAAKRPATRPAAKPLATTRPTATPTTATPTVATPTATPTPTVRSWTSPLQVVPNTSVGAPLLNSDVAGGVHLFVATQRKSEVFNAVTYAHRTAQGEWSPPAIVIGKGAPIRLFGAAIDHLGWVHLLAQGSYRGRIEHHRVYVADIYHRKAWYRPTIVSEDSALRATIIAAPDGSLHVLSAGSNHHLWYVRSDDLGRNWTQPLRLTQHDDRKEACDFPNLAVDGRGRIHAVWNQAHLPSGWPPSGVYYSRSLDGGASWSPSQKLAGDDHALINVATRGDDEVHLVWGSTLRIGTRMHQWSQDGGETWTAAQAIPNLDSGGITGPPGVGFDSAGHLHVVTSVNGPKDIERIFHMVWDGAAWSQPEFVSDGTQATDSVEFPALTIAEGNRVYAAYEGDYRSVWVSEHRAAAPALAPQPLPPLGLDLRSHYADASVGYRIVLAVGALLLLQGLAELAWRGIRRMVR